MSSATSRSTTFREDHYRSDTSGRPHGLGCLAKSGIGYVGVAFIPEHQRLLEDRLLALLEKEMTNPESSLFSSAYSEAVGGSGQAPVNQTAKPKAKVKAKAKGKGKAKPKAKAKAKAKQTKDEQEEGEEENDEDEEDDVWNPLGDDDDDDEEDNGDK